MQSAKTRPGADCGLDHEFLTAKLRLKLKKVGKNTRLLRYDLIKSLTVEVRNKFKGLDLLDRVLDELSMEVCDIVQGQNQDCPQEKEMQKSKMAV